MFSRPVEAGTPGRTLRNLGAWRPSIKIRLTLLFVVCTFVVLLAATVLLYWAVTLSIAHDDQRLLAEKVHVLRTMLAERPDDPTLLSEEVDWETGVLGHARYFVQILDRAGKVTTATPGMASSGIDTRAFPAPTPLSVSNPAPSRVRTAGGRRYLLAAAWARRGTEGPADRIVRIAFDVSHEERILRDFRNIAGLVLLAGVALSAGLGIGITRRGLRPLADMAHTVQLTTITDLHQRIDPAKWPGELTALAHAFNRMLERLESAVARLSGYAAELAHELRTPVNNLMGGTAVILGKPRSGAVYRETLESNLEEYERLAKMIDSLLFLARAENPSGHVHRVELNAAREFGEVMEFHSAAAEEAGVDLRCSGGANLQADRDLLRRALSNLLSNAIAHTPSGGQVSASASRRNDGTVELTVADTGEGIAPAEQEHVFDRFFRGAAARRSGSGSGLGLAIVRTIMDLHQGSVHLESEPGGGTVVTLRFPPPCANTRSHSRTMLEGA
ncbi:MAG: heavy metal sensor histidine kinase [Arenicellales bacterium]